MKQGAAILVVAPLLLTWIAGPPAVRAQGQWQSSTTLHGGDPPRPPGSDSLRAVIVIPLDTMTAVQLTGAADGVDFDIDGDGRKERVAWTRRNAQLAFLFFDRHGDGIVKNGSDLIGGATMSDAWNGFMALRLLAPKAGGAITAQHALFSKLLLWMDRNHDGQSQPEELRRVGEVFQKVGLGYSEREDWQRKHAHGNVVRFQGWLLPATVPADSMSGYSPAYEVVLQVSDERGRDKRAPV